MDSDMAKGLLQLAEAELEVARDKLLANDFCPQCGEPLPDDRVVFIVSDTAPRFAGCKISEIRICHNPRCEYFERTYEPWVEGKSEEEVFELIHGEA